MPGRSRAFGVTGMFGGVALIVALLAPGPAASQRPKEGSPAPLFVLPTLGGDTVRLDALRGHPVILKFWASWCPSCRTELPELVEVVSAHQADGLVVVTIDYEPESKQRPYLDRHLPDASTISVLVDHGRKVQRAYRIPLLPTTMFVDRTGVVRVIHHGSMDAGDLAAGLRTILSPPPPE